MEGSTMTLEIPGQDPLVANPGQGIRQGDVLATTVYCTAVRGIEDRLQRWTHELTESATLLCSEQAGQQQYVDDTMIMMAAPSPPRVMEMASAAVKEAEEALQGQRE